MDWMEMLGLGATAASGGLFGLLGSIVGVVFKGWQEKSAREWELKQHEMKLQTMRVQMEIYSQQGSWEGLKAAMQQQGQISSEHVHRWVNDIRSLFRPAFTVGLWVLAFLVFRQIVAGYFGEQISPDEARELVRYMVYSIFFTAATAGAWWFADRALTPPGLKHR